MFKHRRSFTYITKKAQYDSVFSHGTTKHTKNFVCKQLPTEKMGFGIIVSKKCGNSVARHRIKRMVRECFMKHKETYLLEKTMVFIAKPSAKTATTAQVEQEVLNVCFN